LVEGFAVAMMMMLMCIMVTFVSGWGVSFNYCRFLLRSVQNLAGWWTIGMVTVRRTRRQIIWLVYHEKNHPKNDNKEEGKYDEEYVEPWFVDRFHNAGAAGDRGDLDTEGSLILKARGNVSTEA
jgi:hypothetical protein